MGGPLNECHNLVGVVCVPVHVIMHVLTRLTGCEQTDLRASCIQSTTQSHSHVERYLHVTPAISQKSKSPL